MEKVNTKYVIKLKNETVVLEVNEEYKQQLRIEVYQERRRTKEEYIKLYMDILEELMKFNP